MVSYSYHKVFKDEKCRNWMQKSISFLIMGLALVLTIGAVSAQTVISGTIYNSDYTEEVSGADVTVTCDGLDIQTESLEDGSYSVIYIDSTCAVGSSLTVYAVKGDLYGSKTGTIHDLASTNWDFAVVNVPLVPEFTAVVGGLTILGALGVFFLVRKN